MLGRHAQVAEKNATAPRKLEPGTHQGLGMCTVPLVGRDDEHALMEFARVDASRIVSASHIARKALCYGRHARGHQ